MVGVVRGGGAVDVIGDGAAFGSAGVVGAVEVGGGAFALFRDHVLDYLVDAFVEAAAFFVGVIQLVGHG